MMAQATASCAQGKRPTRTMQIARRAPMPGRAGRLCWRKQRSRPGLSELPLDARGRENRSLFALGDSLGKIYAGTSGWAYATWKPDFYPAKLASAKFLGHYSSRLNTVE